MSPFPKRKELDATEENIMSNINKISEKTGRNTIISCSSWLINNRNPYNYICDLDSIGLMEMCKDLNPDKGLDLIIHTPGGDIAVTEQLIKYIKGIFGNDIRAIVPHLALSGGTMMACACKEIIMGAQSSLGPVDPQLDEIPVQGIIEEAEKAKEEICNNPCTVPYWQAIISNYNHDLIGSCERLWQWTAENLYENLKCNMLVNENCEVIKKIVNELCSYDITKDHTRHLNYIDCKNLGLNISLLENDKELEKLVLSIYYSCIDLFLEQSDISKIFVNQNGDFFKINNLIK